MKSMDVFAQRLFAAAALIGMLLFGSAALIYSTTPATAAGPNTTYGTGKYGMEFESFHDGSTTHWYVLAWDTETGRSKMYYGTSKINKITEAGSSYNLPSSPL